VRAGERCMFGVWVIRGWRYALRRGERWMVQCWIGKVGVELNR
jgi:hypothetical protein